MIKITIASAILVMFAFACAGQEKDKPQTPRPIETLLPDSARFQIVHPIKEGYNSSLFQLDRYTGQVFKLSSCPKDAKVGSEKCWKEMMVIDLPRASVAGQPKFQIFVGGTPQMTLLIQVETGQTWQYGIGEPDKWYPFLDTVVLP